MSIKNAISAVSPAKASAPPIIRQRGNWLLFLRSPLWICLILALSVRIWLVIRTHGIIEGDEALVGIQAQHILKGEHPIYFYAQPYMGSLEAYFLALLFAIAGSSVWTLRAEPILLSLVLVWVTWRLAGALAETARLSPYAKKCFMVIAALCATFPPLYDLVVELRAYGGYIETFIIMLLLLLSALRLTQRWHAGASARELALRWAGIGFLIGLGFWIYPLTVIAVLAAAIWIGGYCAIELVKICWYKARKANGDQLPQQSAFSILRGLLLAATGIPASLIGGAPALYWGARNHWENIKYLLQAGNTPTTLQQRLVTIRQVQYLYRSCSALRVIGGALPTDRGVTAEHPHLLTPALVAGLCCLFVTVAVVGLSISWQHPLLVRVRRLATFPLLFGGCAAFIFCVSSVSAGVLLYKCGPRDLAGRYATPLLLVLPFFYAATLTFVIMLLQGRDWAQGHSEVNRFAQPLQVRRGVHPRLLLQAGVFLVFILFLGTQLYAYYRTDPDITFQTSGCVVAPANSDPIIAYMEKEHIHYAWGSHWVGTPITFKTNSDIIVIEPRIITENWFVNRIPAYTDAVKNADRPSILLLAWHNDLHPDLLKALDALHITYRVARFPSEPGLGVDLLVVTPLNRSVPPSSSNSLDTNFNDC